MPTSLFVAVLPLGVATLGSHALPGRPLWAHAAVAAGGIAGYYLVDRRGPPELQYAFGLAGMLGSILVAGNVLARRTPHAADVKKLTDSIYVMTQIVGTIHGIVMLVGGERRDE